MTPVTIKQKLSKACNLTNSRFSTYLGFHMFITENHVWDCQLKALQHTQLFSSL